MRRPSARAFRGGLVMSAVFLGSVLSGAALAAQPAGGPAAFDRATVSNQQFTLMIALGEFVPCANGGVGELVNVSGRIHGDAHATIDSRGGTSLHAAFNFQDMSGVGMTTGDRYHEVGANTNTFTSNGATETTTVATDDLIGQGPGNNLTVRSLIHTTINANGEITANVVSMSVTCR